MTRAMNTPNRSTTHREVDMTRLAGLAAAYQGYLAALRPAREGTP